MEGNENVVGLLTDIKELLGNSKKTMNVDDLVRYTGLSKSKIYKLTQLKLIPMGNNPHIRQKFFDKDTIVFENNLTYLTNDSFGSQFNSDWANKLLICIDEVLFNKEELTERIKYLSTTNRNKLETKGKDKREVEFFGKFILCSNNEDSFIKIDGNETRFGVRKVPTLKNERTDFLECLIEEIPGFLHFLSQRKPSVPQASRMWFTPGQIRTPALTKLVQKNRNRVEKELASLLLSAMEKFEMESVDLCPVDALHMLNKTWVKTDLTQLRRLLKKDWKLENRNNSDRYQKITIWANGEINVEDAKGRYFTVKKEFLTQNFDETMTD